MSERWHSPLPAPEPAALSPDPGAGRRLRGWATGLGGLAWAWLSLALAYLAYHRVLTALRPPSHSPGNIGALAQPFHAYWEWSGLSVWWLPALAAVGLLLVTAGVVLDRRCPPWRAVLLSAGVFVALGMAVSMVDGMREYKGRLYPGFVWPLAWKHHDYFGDVPQVERAGVRAFVERYARPRMFVQLSIHSRSHPPGPVLLHWLLSRAFGYNPWSGSLAIIGVAALAVPLLYLFGREIYGDGVARRAVLVWLATPSVLLMSITSMDAVFAVLALATLWPFALWRRQPDSRLLPLAIGAVMAVGSFMTYSVAFVGVLMAVITLLAGPRGPRRWLVGGALALAAFCAVHLLLVVGLGHRPIAALRAAMAYDARLMGSGVETFGRYLEQSVVHVMAFLMGLGVATAAAWLAGFGAAFRGLHGRRAADPVALAVTLTVVGMAFSSLFSYEVERVWLFMVPAVALVAARHLEALEARMGTRAALHATLLVSGLQAILAEASLWTLR